MHSKRKFWPSSRLWIAALFVLLLTPNFLHAEGSGTELELTQALQATSVLYVDILDADTETITWTGVGTVDILEPDELTIVQAGVTSGTTVALAGRPDGAYRIDINSNQTAGVVWDITVNNQVSAGGRLFSFSWDFRAPGFNEANSTDASFFAIVEGGSTNDLPVVELRLDGLAGFQYEILANASGVDGANAGRSVPQVGNSVTAQHAIYLNPPTVATYTSLTPEISQFVFEGEQIGGGGGGGGGGSEECNAVIPGETTGEFTFETDVSGTFRITCDLNGDGEFDPSSDDDLTIQGTATVGDNTVEWDVTDNTGTLVDAGEYDCTVTVTVGEFHYVGRDIETSFEGLRMFEVNADLSKTPLDMFWNDTDVQANVVTMPDAQIGLENSGPDGINSGPYGDAADPNVNARSWGNFTNVSKGNLAFLDTYTFTRASESTTLKVVAVGDEADDTDGDEVPDFEEICTHGTDPSDCDTDDDGLCDGFEINTTETDPLDPDTDGDLVQDGTEVGIFLPQGNDTDLTVFIPDSEPFSRTDPLDPDTDDDGCTDGTEDANVNGGINSNESDPLLPDTDGDGVTDCEDNCPATANADQSDLNGDGMGDVCSDADGDGIADALDNCPTVANVTQVDSDGDGTGDVCVDSDQDGIFDLQDNCPNTANPSQNSDACTDETDPESITDTFQGGGLKCQLHRGESSTKGSTALPILVALSFCLLLLVRRKQLVLPNK